MANTIMSAKNSFEEGLLMDLSPDNTQANCMTSALNATLITLNGNEMLLQNDMGNGRVETARLPEGYVPVGTCEFGDIIYIVSYNPLDKKAQIGCFPSPERNITSDEMSDLGLSLSYLDFLNPSPDGTLKKTSVKKVLVETKKLNPGDKYIIYSNQTRSINDNSALLSDYGLKKHDVLPKVVKLHVVSIEDSGKITYLDTTTKWYGDYYIKEGAVKVSGGKTDLDSYRSLVESEWSIFSSKASGKLAILAELETIDSFSCSYSLEGGEISTEGNIEYKNYKLILEPDYDGREGIIVPYICITNGTFSRPEEVDSNSYDATKSVFYYNSNKEKITYLYASSLEPHSSYGWPFAESIATTDSLYNFKIPYKEIVGKYKTPINSDSFVYNFSVVPTMGTDAVNVYGRLDHLKVDLSIDFNKVGTGEVDFTQWKYHNSEETSVLTYSINTYPKPGYEVKFIQMDFYDNQGHVALYILDDKKSYNGVFNEYFGLGGQGSNIRLSRYKIPTPGSAEWDSTKKPSEQEKTIIYHNAEKLKKEEISDMYDYDYCDRGGDNYYRNDAGTLYFGVLYAVKITVWQANKTTWESKEFCRWYWTNPMYNEYYYNTKDFNSLNFELVLDSKALFATNPSKYIWQQEEINNLGNDFGDYDHYKTYSANVLHIGRNIGEDNIHMYVQAGLQDNYGCFNLSNKTRNEINDLSQIKTEIFLSQGQISYNISGDQHEFSGESTNVSDPVFLLLESIDIKDGIEADFNYLNTKPINTEEIKISGLKDDFNIIFGNNIDSYGSIDRNFKPEDTDIITPKLTTTLDKCYYLDENNKKEIPLSMSAILYNKAYTQNIYSNNISVPVYTPIINSEDDFGNLGLGVVWEDNTADAKYRRDYNDGTIKMGFLTAMNISLHGDDFSGVNFTRNSSLTFTSPAGGDDANYIMYTGSREVNTSSDEEFISKVWAPISDKMGHFFLVYPGGNHGTHGYSITEGLYNFPNINNWYNKHLLGYRSTPSSYFVESCYDISKGGQFRSMSGANIVGFLGIKHNKGFTLFNLAFVDYYYGTQEFLQAARLGGYFLEFESFAYHLYLILSNTFHKNKRIDDAYINLRNYVRNKRYEVTLTKNIVIKLSEQDPNADHNIAMLGMDFIEYRNEILKFITSDIKLLENVQLLTESSNVHLKFIESAINNVLTITVTSQPLLFTNTEASAYIQYNGLLIPSVNLADDTFYIYLNGKLIQSQNKILKFDIKEVDKNLRYLFSNLLPEMSSDNWKNTTLKLRGVHPPLLQSLTPLQKAYNRFVDLIYEQMLTINVSNFEPMNNLYVSTTDVNIAKNRIINLALGLLPSIIEGYNKYDLHRYAIERMPNTSESWVSGIEWMGSYETYFSVYDRGIGVDYDRGQYVLEMYLHNRMNYEVTYNDATEYSFDTLFNLKRLFDYENNMLTLKPNAVVSNFGIKDDPNGNDTHGAAYSGFIKDVIIDKNFLIV